MENRLSSFIPPAGYRRIGIVSSFEELVSASFGPDVNALCWPRQLPGDFDAVASCFAKIPEILSLDEEALMQCKPGLGQMGQLALAQLLEDSRLMRAHGLAPSLECVPRYLRDEFSLLPTDVYSFHADRAPVPADTYLCSYNGSATEALRNEEALHCTDQPETRAALRRIFDEEGGDDFEEYLRENCYDLHYIPTAGAVPFSFGLGHMWRIAIEYPGCPVAPCIHRAPETLPGQLPRLLLIS